MDYFSSDDATGTQASESLAHPVENGSPERFYLTTGERASLEALSVERL
jgi:hypothetical protein